MLSGAKHLRMQECRILRPFAVGACPERAQRVERAAQGDVISCPEDGEGSRLAMTFVVGVARPGCYAIDSRISSIVARRQVYIGVSRSVYFEDSVSRRS